MRGFVVTYRWELWLILGIPAIASMSLTVSSISATFFISDGNVASHFTSLVGSVVSLLLQAVFYRRVRNLGRDFLRVLWGYFIAASVIGVATFGVLFLVGIVLPAENNATLIRRTFAALSLASLLSIPVLLWFARQASRLSLTHAFFLLVYSSVNLTGPEAGSTSSSFGTYSYWVLLFTGAAIGLAVALTKVWLLGNFERRGPRFRRNAVVVLLAALILAWCAELAIAALVGDAVLGTGFFIAMNAFLLPYVVALFGFVYVVRVRTPATEDEPELETPTAELDEER